MGRFPILTVTIFTPLLGALIIIFTPKEKIKLIKILALAFSSISLLLSVILLAKFDPYQITNEFGKFGAHLQFVDKVDWIRAIGATYFVGVDGISLPLLFIATLLSFLAIIASWNIDYRAKEYFWLILILEVGMIGVFLALDFILFFIFWEMVLVPMYFLIGIWGGPRKEYAAIKFFLYTFFGSIFLLLGILAVYFYSSKLGPSTFNMVELAQHHAPPYVETLAFLGMFLGFAVKVPMVPFHTWLPDAHVEAPTAVSVLLAGVLLKMGTYAFVRIGLGVVDHGMLSVIGVIAIMGVISIIYGAFNAMVQKDLKSLVAYSSISHMGFVMLGIATLTVSGTNGAILYMFSHGAITGMLFLLVGLVYERTHTRIISELGGLFTTIPLIAGIFAYTAFAALGLPSLSGFIGELLVLLGTFLKGWFGLGILAAIGIIITAGYMLWTIQRVCMGESREFAGVHNMPDADWRELTTLIPLVIIIFAIGIYPMFLLYYIKPTVETFLTKLP